MPRKKPARNRLELSNQELRARLEEAEDTLRAIRSGEVDAIVVSGPQGDKVYTLQGAEQPYRVLVETMNEGTVTLLPDGTVAYCNSSFSTMARVPLEKVIGSLFERFLPSNQRPLFKLLLERGRDKGGKEEFNLLAGNGELVPVELAAKTLGSKEANGFCLVITDLTERRRAEAALRQANAYNRSLIEASIDPLVTISPEGIITDVNSGTEKVTGLTRQELIGTDFSNYFTEPEKARSGYEQVFREGFVHDYELEIRHLNGHATPVLYNAAVYRDEAGKITGVFAAARDITKRKQAEQARAYLASIVESSDDAIIGKSLEGVIQSWNRGAEKLYGYTASEVIGQSISLLLSPERREEFAGLLDQIRKGVGIEHHETVRVAKGGRLVDVSISISPVEDASGRIVGASSTARDITARKRDEAALARANAYNRSLIEASLDPLVTIAPDGKITDVNSATEKVTGHTRQELIGTDFSDYFTEPDKARAGYQRVFREGFVHDYGLEIRHHDGHTAPVLYNASVYRDKGGQVIGVFAAARDITERRKAEEEIRKLNESLELRVAQRTAELAATNKELEAFTYSVSHDLRAPLRHIDGFSKMLLEEGAQNLTEDSKRYLSRIREGTERMGQLVDDLLNLARVGRREVNLKLTGLSSLVQEAVEEIKRDCAGRQIEWTINPLPFVECDPGLMKQVFVNLLSNAAKYTRPRPEARIEVGVLEENGEPVIYVRDNGVGFSMKYADKLFGVFQRLHRAEDFEGTGIGLATVQRILRKHGGRAWAKAELEKGATFYFTLGGEKSQIRRGR
jgi:PAS domain S-box-containing protein